ncbi:MAG TPA: acetyl-CoA carboxylase biotin carboxyl carrier protein [Dongiaceae bacterium]|nr:acetyl-CoA carboxylase biotin carboxyl carrier protein [Dongiaceae bacterium]
MSDKKGVSLEAELVRELAAILKESGLSEIELEQGGLKLRLSRHGGGAAAPAVVYAPAPTATAPAALPAPAATPAVAAEAPAADARTHPGAVTSPMVGTAYLSPEPGAAVFIKVGDTVSEGQTLMVVEAMKTFNPIPAPKAGKVKQILVADAQPVEYGEPLVIIE